MEKAANSFWQDFGKPILVLVLICAVVSLALASTYGVTKPIIEENQLRKAELARSEVYPGAESFIQLTNPGTDGCKELYQTSDGSGYVVTVTAKGFGGTMEVMVGISGEGTLLGVKVMSHEETPGLGSRVAEEEHIGQYTGKDKQLDGVERIVGASVSSKALKTAVENAFAAVEAAKQ